MFGSIRHGRKWSWNGKNSKKDGNKRTGKVNTKRKNQNKYIGEKPESEEDMRTITIANLKGGVGKSTTAINMALMLSQTYEKKVLLIDNDFQANATKFFEKHDYERKSMEDVLGDPELYPQEVITKSGRYKLDLIPANMNLVAAADNLMMADDADQLGRIERITESVSKEYDYCIIDCHPGVGIEVLNALVAADDIVIPIKADKNALDGMEELNDVLQEIRAYNAHLKSVKCLVTMFTKDTDVVMGEEALKDSQYDMYETHIRYSKKVTAWTYENGKSLIETTPRSAATRDYKKFVKEYLRQAEMEG